MTLRALTTALMLSSAIGLPLAGVAHAQEAATAQRVTPAVAQEQQFDPTIPQNTPRPAPAPVASAQSPSGVLSIEVSTNGEGRPFYRLMRQGTPVITDSRLGFLLADGPKLERNMALTAQSSGAHDDTWEQPWGERQFVRNRYNELRVTFTETKAPGGRAYDVVFRLYDDGLGFRYEFPEAWGEVEIADELTEFSLASDGEAWWTPAGEWNRYEYLYNRTPISDVGRAHTPITVKLDTGVYVAFHEAALVDYAGMWLRRVEGTRFRAQLSPGADGAPSVVRQAPFPTPWRTLQISDSAPGLYMSDLILNLNEPNKLGDVSWVEPFKYVGIWWGMHLGTWSWASGPIHGATTENTKAYIDFAAENGIRGVLVEGWNVGWDGDWFGSGADMNFTQPYPDFDIEYLTRYAREKGVRLVGHHETGGNAAHYESQLEAAMAYYERLGIDSVKTGYVADAGQAQVRLADGTTAWGWHDGQEMARHHLRVVETAARHQIAVNPHEPIKDTGLRRTYPNWVAREGARGMEYSAWGQPPNPPEHEANLVFTRMLSGPMDYTPGIFNMATNPGSGVQTTLAKQLADYVVIYSPIQMLADLPENYEARPQALQFLRDVPTDWSDTRVLSGEIGDYVVIARKDRAGDDWYLGAVTDEFGRALSADLSFLDPGRRYTAQIYRDGPTADWSSNPYDIVIEERTVTAGDTLPLNLAPGGGQAIRFVAQGRSRR